MLKRIFLSSVHQKTIQKSSALQKISGVSLSEVKNYVLGNYIGILWFHRFFHHESYKEI